LFNEWESFWLCFGSTGDWAQGLSLARKVLYHWSQTSSSFAFKFVSYRVLCFYSGSASDHHPPTSVSQVTRIIAVYHHVLPRKPF
jgi:hypothetical protein